MNKRKKERKTDRQKERKKVETYNVRKKPREE